MLLRVIDTASTIVDRWLARHATAAPEALAAVAGMIPAVVVTGGSAGIGLAIAREFAGLGHHVLLVARDRVRLEAAHNSICQASRSRVHTLALDVTASGAAAAIDRALAGHGLYLDVLVNSAGTGYAGRFLDADEPAITGLIDLNASALAILMRHAIEGMVARGRGGVLNVSSIAGFVPGPYQAAYYASKAFVCSLTVGVAAELAGTGVRVTVVAPGPVETGFHAAMGAEGALYRRLLPSMSPRRVARAAVTGYRLGRTVVVPGILPRLLVATVCILPHWVTLPFVKRLIRPPQSS